MSAPAPANAPESIAPAPAGVVVTSLRQFVDGLVNFSTGLGSDKASTDWVWSEHQSLGLQVLGTLYRRVAYAGKAVDRPVNDALGKGYKIGLAKGRDDATNPAWMKEKKRLKVDRAVSSLRKWARAYGAAYGVLITDDDAPVDAPLDLSALRSLRQILPLPATLVTPNRLSVATRTSMRTDGAAPGFMTPVTYNIAYPSAIQEALGADAPEKWRRALAGGTPVHHSRIVRVIGREIPPDQALYAFAEGDSVLEPAFAPLCNLVGAGKAAALIASEMNIDVLTNPRLETASVGDGADQFDERMDNLNRSKSIANLLLLGAGETFTTRSKSVSGFETLREAAVEEFCAAVEIPAVIFMARDSQGMSGKPGIAAESYMSTLREEWIHLSEALGRIYTVVRAQKSGPYRGRWDVAFDISPKALREETPQDYATRRLVTIQATFQAVGAGVIPPEYAAEHFQGPDGFLFDLPPYEAAKYPPPRDPTAIKSSPNKEGKNAPGQAPPEPDTPGGVEGANGADLNPEQ